MKIFNVFRLLVVTALAVSAPMALAHSGHGHTSGFEAGFLHPFMGLDHLVAMLAVGLWAGRLGGKATFIVPVAFVGTMIIACILAVMGLHVPFMEQGIVLSVIALGILLAAASKFSTPICAVMVAAFAFFHGAAHGSEMPAELSSVMFVIGFSAASMILHVAGIALNSILPTVNNHIITRIAGGVIALTGLSMAIA